MVALLTVLSTYGALLFAFVPALVSARRSESTGLLVRQANAGTLIDPGVVPNACQNTCNSLDKSINSCTNAACACGTAVVQSIGDCLSCAVNTEGSAVNVTFAHSLAEAYTNTCNSRGVNVGTIAITGGSAGEDSGAGPSKGSAGDASSGNGTTRPTTTIGGVAMVAFAFFFTLA